MPRGRGRGDRGRHTQSRDTASTPRREPRPRATTAARAPLSEPIGNAACDFCQQRVRKLNKGIMIAPFFNNAGVAIPDVFATNGVVHVIDKVLIPPGFSL